MTESELKKAVLAGGELPRHVAIIMDGNGRWAKARGLPRLAGHRAGVESVREIVRASSEIGIQVLTLYAFSVENWHRPAIEIRGLMAVLKETLRREQADLDSNNVRLSTIGREADLPADVRRQIDKTRNALSHNDGLILNLALSYGGRAEIVDVTRSFLEEAKTGRIAPEDVTEETFAARLYTAGLPDPDLVIRTSGELRVSNFLLWQIAYAEMWVTPTHWPDFRREHFYSALLAYQGRDRRFGRTESRKGAGSGPVSPAPSKR